MANKAADHYPFAMASRVLWQIGKYLIYLMIIWLIFIYIFATFISWILKKAADSNIAQQMSGTFNEILGNFTDKQIPSPNGAADGMRAWVVHMKEISTGSIPLYILGGIVVLYFITIILRHHYREQAPFLNDVESKILKLKLRYSLGTGKDDFYDEENRKVRKVELAARRRLRFMRVHIHTKKKQGEAVPTKQYDIKVVQPRSTRVDNEVLRKINKMPTVLRRQTGGVNFGDMERTTDGKWYRFRGSEEAKLKEARSVKKQRKANSTSKGKKAKAVKEKPIERTFPLDLFVDRTKDIAEKEAAAKEFAERMQKEITDFLTSTEKSVTHQNTHVGNTSVMYKYRVSFTKNSSSEKQAKAIEEGLSDKLEVMGILVQGGSGFIRITLPLKEGEDEDVKYDYSIPIDVKTMIEKIKFSSETDMILGITPDSKIIHFPLYKQPHLLLAGATRSGKSVNIQQMLISIMIHNTPADVRFGIVDPKEVDFQFYEDLPYMIANPIQDMSQAKDFLEYTVIEMGKRQKMLKHAKVRNIEDYNIWAKKNGNEKMPYWVIVIDEFADLIMQFKEVEEPVKRLTQKARAVGIHLIIGTQTPRANILTGQIKANVPTRVSMRVSGSIESGIILDETGAERLKNGGDMLIKRADVTERAQGAFISDDEINRIFEYLRDKFEKPVFPDFVREVARENGELEDDETGGQTSTTLSVKADRKRPVPTESSGKSSSSAKSSIKGKVKVPTSNSSMAKIRERAKARKMKNEQVQGNSNESSVEPKNEPKNEVTTDKPKQEKKKADMSFFLGK